MTHPKPASATLVLAQMACLGDPAKQAIVHEIAALLRCLMRSLHAASSAGLSTAQVTLLMKDQGLDVTVRED